MAARRVWIASLVACALGSTVGCDGQGEAAAPPDSPTESSSTAPQDTVTTEPAAVETPPPLPEAANGEDAAAAIAFVEHWVATLNYSNLTGDFEPIRALNSPSCEVCERILEGPVENAALGFTGSERQSGGQATLSDLGSLPADFVAPGADQAVVARVSFSEQVFFDEGGTEVSRVEPSSYIGTFSVDRSPTGWTVLDIGVS